MVTRVSVLVVLLSVCLTPCHGMYRSFGGLPSRNMVMPRTGTSKPGLSPSMPPTRPVIPRMPPMRPLMLGMPQMRPVMPQMPLTRRMPHLPPIMPNMPLTMPYFSFPMQKTHPSFRQRVYRMNPMTSLMTHMTPKMLRLGMRTPTRYPQPMSPFEGLENFLGMGRKRNIRTTPNFLGAKQLGCKFGIDSESVVALLYPKGCSPAEDFCALKFPGHKCMKSGPVGMCCPVFVNQVSIDASTLMVKAQSVAEMFSK